MKDNLLSSTPIQSVFHLEELMLKPHLIDRLETQKLLHIGRSRYYALCKQADFPTVKIGNKILVDYDALINIWLPSKASTTVRGIK